MIAAGGYLARNMMGESSTELRIANARAEQYLKEGNTTEALKVLREKQVEVGSDKGERTVQTVLLLMGIFGGIWIFTGGIFFYIGKQIVEPFEKMSALAEELSKGNLSVPLPEIKNRYFGRFLWGMDMLREELEQSREKELALLKEKQTLLLSLSHDLRTPLSAIELYTRALSENLYEEEEKRKQSLEGIAKSAKEIRGYANRITEAAREEFLSLEVKPGEFYLSKVLRDMKEFYGEKLAQVHTEFKVREMVDSLVCGDPDRVTEVLQNLMENAMKYGDGKSVCIEVTEEEECRLITIRNTGCTLPEEELTNLFDPFWRGSNSQKVEGSGLGLYICRELLHKMDGDIFAQIRDQEFLITAVLRKR